MGTSDRETKPMSFADALATVELTPGEASQIFYAWASNFHDGNPDLAAKLRESANKLAYPPASETKTEEPEAHSTRRRVTAE